VCVLEVEVPLDIAKTPMTDTTFENRDAMMGVDFLSHREGKNNCNENRQNKSGFQMSGCRETRENRVYSGHGRESTIESD
jgi:hypothetical protein